MQSSRAAGLGGLPRRSDAVHGSSGERKEAIQDRQQEDGEAGWFFDLEEEGAEIGQGPQRRRPRLEADEEAMSVSILDISSVVIALVLLWAKIDGWG